MKTMSLEEALNKRLVYKDNRGGIGLNNLKRGSFFVIDSQKPMDDIIKSINEPSIIIGDEGQSVGVFTTTAVTHPRIQFC